MLCQTVLLCSPFDWALDKSLLWVLQQETIWDALRSIAAVLGMAIANRNRLFTASETKGTAAVAGTAGQVCQERADSPRCKLPGPGCSRSLDVAWAVHTLCQSQCSHTDLLILIPLPVCTSRPLYWCHKDIWSAAAPGDRRHVSGWPAVHCQGQCH